MSAWFSSKATCDIRKLLLKFPRRDRSGRDSQLKNLVRAVTAVTITQPEESLLPWIIHFAWAERATLNR